MVGFITGEMVHHMPSLSQLECEMIQASLIALAIAMAPSQAGEVHPMFIELSNIDRDLVASGSAAIIAKSVMEEYYSADLFVCDGQPTVVDVGEYWRVTMRNTIERARGDGLRITVLIVNIRKRDGGIVNVSAGSH